MIVTSTGIVVFPSDSLFAALTSRTEWQLLPSVTDHQLVRTFPVNQSTYMFIKSCQTTADYFAIKENLIHDIRTEIEARSP